MADPPPVTVEQRHRDAAADLLESGGSKGILCRFDHAVAIRHTEHLDNDPFVQAFARFDHERNATLEREIAALREEIAELKVKLRKVMGSASHRNALGDQP